MTWAGGGLISGAGGLTWGLIADGLLAVLLLVTIVFAAALNRKLGALRKSRAAMELLIADFSAATLKAEGGLAELKRRAEAAGGDLARRLDAGSSELQRAEALSGELAALLREGAALAERLEDDIEGARRHEGSAVEAGASEAGAVTPAAGGKVRRARPSPLTDAQAEEGAEGDPASEGELPGGLRRALESLR